MATIIAIEGLLPPPNREAGSLATSCCKTGFSVLRDVHDTVSFSVEDFEVSSEAVMREHQAVDPVGREVSVLHVVYSKVYPGDADEFRVTCDGCGEIIHDIDIQED